MKKENEITLEGRVSNIIFTNSENGYTVFSMETNDSIENIICISYSPFLKVNEEIKIKGEYTNHPKFGNQFNVSSFEEFVPTSTIGIEKYLSSGIIEGIGKARAKKIVEKFGEQTIEIIEKTPQKLTEIKGITEKIADNIHNSFIDNQEFRNIMIALGEYDITPNVAIAIYKKYKIHSLSVIKENPYSLVSTIFGVSFKTADKIAKSVGIDPFSHYRIKACILHVLSIGTNKGHVCIRKESLREDFFILLDTSEKQNTSENNITDLLENCLVELQLKKDITIEKINGETFIYQKYFYYSEIYVAKKLLELSKARKKFTENIENKLEKIEKELEIKLAIEQKIAVLSALEESVFVITGGPGTGKTTIIKTIITLMMEEGQEVELAAPTGRAAKRMTEATGVEAKTIHRLLGINFAQDSHNQIFDKNEENPIEADIVIIDETSMLDMILMNHLLKAIAFGTRIIFVGDENQLPSVGAGNVLKNIISSELIKVVHLKEIFRQAKESLIITNAHRINTGIYPILDDKNGDFFFMSRKNQEDGLSTILDLCQNRLIKYGFDISEIQVLCPMRKNIVGTTNLNEKLQEALNPLKETQKEVHLKNIIFRENDRVMQLKNNYEIEWEQNIDNKTIYGKGIFNGDEGYIQNIDEDSKRLTVVFYDGKIVDYSFKQLEELTLSYAITIHKSQGSEYGVVIIPAYFGPPMLYTRNLLYTAITRAKKMVIFVGVDSAIFRMVDNDKEEERNSFLDYRLKKMDKLWSNSDDD
ncbi:MAG: ATP-dependent RecD-like DNA helicase [Defluviitaleaceae bacterium]|nr:ATP-dependent RecD-like DNA helicase [Defluviitaleaceae bacterium]